MLDMISMKLLIVLTVILCYGNVIHGAPEARNQWGYDFPTTFPYSNSYPGYYYYSPNYYVPNYYGIDYRTSLGVARHPYGGLSYVEKHGIGKRSADPGYYNRPLAISRQHVSIPYSEYHIVQRHQRSAPAGL